MDIQDAADRGGHDVHRALSSPVRRRLLELLRDAPAPWDAGGLAEQVGLHQTTVRSHLVVLEDAGLVASRPEDRDRVGRPRRLYEATATDAADAAPAGADDGYRLLAQMLASYVSATSRDPVAAGEAAGDAWGRHLVEGPAPFQQLDPDEAVERLTRLLDEVGFQPQLERDGADALRVELHRCPFLDVARQHQDIVCSLHRGMMRGALGELGTEVAVAELRPFVRPDLCVADLRAPSDPPGRAVHPADPAAP